MKIKEAAQYCGLTEKAIRLYEQRGLIHPATEEKNGRTFRDYDEEAIRALTTVGILRRAAFSLEQITMMQSSPEQIPEIFAAYREEVRENALRMAILARAMDALPTGEEEMDLDALARQLARALPESDVPPALQEEWLEESARTPAPRKLPRAHVWDEDVPPDEKEAAYQRFLRRMARRERVQNILLAIPRRLASLLRPPVRWMKKQMLREDGRLRTSAAVILLLVLMCSCLIGALGSVHTREEAMKREHLVQFYAALRNAEERLRWVTSEGVYTAADGETLTADFAVMHALLAARNAYEADGVFGSFQTVANAVGSHYAVTLNGTPVRSVLYDGTVTEAELALLGDLCADLTVLRAVMLAPDGLNLRYESGFTFDDIQPAVGTFLEKWGKLRLMEGEPYAALVP